MIATRCIFYFLQGKLVGGCCALSGVFILTLPIPIVVTSVRPTNQPVSQGLNLLSRSFASIYKNRLWRNEVEHKKKEMTKQLLAEMKDVNSEKCNIE